jgi:hypothetical protein
MQGDAEVRLLDVLLDVIAVALAIDPPVEIAEIIAGDVLPVLGELDRESLVRARVASVDRPHLRGAREELEPPDRVDHLGREQFAELGWGGFGHAGIGGNGKEEINWQESALICGYLRSSALKSIGNANEREWELSKECPFRAHRSNWAEGAKCIDEAGDDVVARDPGGFGVEGGEDRWRSTGRATARTSAVVVW